MDDRWDRIFSVIWRVNAVLLLGIGVIGLGGALMLAATLVVSAFDRPERPRLTQVAGEDLQPEELELGTFRAIDGTDLLLADLDARSGDAYLASGSYGRRSVSRNLLFFDTRSGAAHWLFPDHHQVIRWRQFIRPEAESERAGGDEVPPTALLLQVEPVPDPRASDPPSGRLVVATTEGRTPKTIATQVEGLLGEYSVRPDRSLIFYWSQGVARVLDLDPLPREVRSDVVLAVGE